MNKKTLIGLLVCIVIVVLAIFTVILIINTNDLAKQKKAYCKKVYDEMELIIAGKALEANMSFIDNYENKEINKTYMNLSREELLDKGYMEYIQQTDYMIEFYTKIVVSNVEYVTDDKETIKFNVTAKRPNLLKIMNECDTENVDNDNYDFNKTFIEKMQNNKFEYEEGTYEIIGHIEDNDIKFEYTENFKNLLYSEN